MKKLFLCGLVVLLICFVPATALTAVDDYYAVFNGRCDYNFQTLSSPIENDVLSNSQSVKIDLTRKPLYGSIIMEDLNNGILVYFTGPYNKNDCFYYRLYDGKSYSNIAKVTINVIPSVEDPPIRRWYYTQTDTVLIINDVCSPFYLDNIWITSGVSHGKITFINGQLNEYKPNAGFTGWDKFTYKCIVDTAEYGLCRSNEAEAWIWVGEPPYPAPEFPSTILPVTMIIGFLVTVLYIHRTRQH